MDYRPRLRHIREDRDLTQSETGRAELKIDDRILLCRFYNPSCESEGAYRSENPPPVWSGERR